MEAEDCVISTTAPAVPKSEDAEVTSIPEPVVKLGKLNNAPVAVVVAASTAIVLVVAISESTCNAYPPSARFASIKSALPASV